jgi:CheY-like chemotaxis protein
MTEKPIALIVEDDPNQADIFTTALQQADYETKTISDGQEALNWLATETPHIVILDLNLPEVTGDKILAHIRSDERLTNIRVVLATANPRQAEELRDQSDLVLIKPINFAQLKLLAERLHPSHSTPT